MMMREDIGDRAEHYKDNREKIVKEISDGEDAEESLSKAKKYLGALEYEGEEDEKLKSLKDSLEYRVAHGVPEVDSAVGNTAYMSHQLSSNPRELSGRLFSGWKVNFSRDVGKDIYGAVRSLNEKYDRAEKIRILLTAEECRNVTSGNMSSNVPSGSFVVDDFRDVLDSNDADSFINSLTWEGEWKSAFMRGGQEVGFDECSGSFY